MRKKLIPDARIDLHGMTQNQAYSTLKIFLERAVRDGKKHVLVITGKGSFENPGIIKTETPRWLQHTELKRYVSSFCSADISLGGSGAIMITLVKSL